MELPGAQNAVIDDARIRQYLLSASHPIGRFKAAFFRRLGYSEANWGDFREALRRMTLGGRVIKEERSRYGRKFLVRGILEGPGGASAVVISAWLLAHGERRPRLITVYPE